MLSLQVEEISSGNILDSSGNLLDAAGNIILNVNDNSNNTIIEGATSFFSIFNNIKKLSVNYYLDYEPRDNKYLKRLDFEVNNNNDLIDISSIIIIEPKSINDIPKKSILVLCVDLSPRCSLN